LPFRDAERLLVIWEKNPSQNRYKLFVAPVNFLAWQKQIRAVRMAALQETRLNLTGGPNGHIDPEELKVERVTAGYGKVAVIEELEHRLGITPDRMIYVGDGSSDVHVMLHVNNRDGFTIAVSENKQLARIAKSTVLSDNAFSIMVPILDQLLHWRTGDIRTLFESYGLTLNEWEKERTDRVTISEILSSSAPEEAEAA